MNTEIAVHPKLLHYGLTTGNLDAMLEWYRKVLGMTVNKRVNVPADRAPLTAVHSQATTRSIIASRSSRRLTPRSIPKGPAMLGFSTRLHLWNA